MSDVTRRNFLKATGVSLGSWALAGCQGQLVNAMGKSNRKKPNIIFILADDLGYNELGCYGQTKIKTPNIDRIAAEGMRFTQHYSGSTVCAPSRCVLMTGKHTGHAYVRDNYEVGGWERGDPEGQLPIPADTVTVAKILKKAGYTTGAIGKWGLGGPDSEGHPNNQGFDHWFGYLCQRQAHNYYPTHLWRNNQKQVLDNEYFKAHQKLPKDKDPQDPASYEPYSGKDYAPDLMGEDALDFIRKNKDKPFFLYFPTLIPHVSLQVPEDSLAQYKGKLDDKPYTGGKGYLPHPEPHAGYAGMITRMDRTVGRIMKLLKQLKIDDNTLVIFTSDNGPTFNGGTDSKYFNSPGPFRGLKCSLYEGGIRVPFIARWPGKIMSGSTSDYVSAFWDFMPTVTDLLGLETPGDIDGISILPTLIGDPEDQQKHEYLYWEYARKMQAVRWGEWKAVRKKPSSAIELYNLKSDIGEKNNVADQYPDVVKKIGEIMQAARTPSEHFSLVKPT